MFLKSTPQLLQQIKDSGVPIIKLSMEEFQKIASEGKILTNEEAKQVARLALLDRLGLTEQEAQLLLGS